MLPLDDLTVLDFSTLLPGPMASLFLAEAGARVIRVERPGGEEMRRFPPRFGETSAPYAVLNRGKASVEIDLKAPDALARLTPLIEQTARRHQLEPALLHAVITVESGYHASAASPKGAQGLMQLMPDTAARFGVSAETVLEPRANLDAGARYLAFLLGLFDRRLDLALAAYNAGEGVVQRLGRIQPATLGQAARIEGVTPAALTAILAGVKKRDARRV